MLKQYVYTSSLSMELKEDLEVYAARHKVSKNKVIQKALKRFLAEERKKAYAESFQRANKDPEMKSMADWGLDDYLEQLKALEK